MSTFRLWPYVGVAVLSGAVGFGTSNWLRPSDASLGRSAALEQQEARLEQAPRKLEACQPTSEAPPAHATVAIDTTGLREEIRQILKEELRAAAAPTAPAAEPRPTERPPEPDAQSVAAFNQGRGLVESAVATGRWSESQRQELRALLPQLTPEQQQQVTRALVVGINSGRMKVETNGPPL